MLMECSVNISNHGELGRWARAKMGLCTQKKLNYLMVSTARTSYKFSLENLKRIHSSALEFHDPNVTVNIKDCDKYRLKVLMKQCKVIGEGQSGTKLPLPSASEIEKYKPKATRLSIVNNDYTLDSLRNPYLQRISITQTPSLPKCIWNLANLTTLIINDCGLCGLPPKILQICANLKSLDLSRNKIRRIEPCILVRMKNLSHLDLSRNCLKFLPLHIGRLKQLATLNLSHNQLQALPFTFPALEKLKELYLANNCIESLNEAFLELLARSRVRLTSLDVSGNPFKPLESKEYPFKIPDLFSLAAAKVLQRIKLILRLYDHLPYDIEDFIHIRSELCCTCKKPFLRYSRGTSSKSFHLGRISSSVSGSGYNYNVAPQYTINCYFCQQRLDILEPSKENSF